MLMGLTLILLFSYPYSWAQETHKLFIDSLPRGAKVWVADKTKLPEKIDCPQSEEFYKGITPLVVEVKPAIYAVHIQVPLTAFALSKPANTIVEKFAEEFMKQQERGPYYLGGGVESPFLWCGSSTTTYNYEETSAKPVALGHLFYANCEKGDARMVGIWWPKGLSFEDMEPLMPPEKESFTVEPGPIGTLTNKYKLSGDNLKKVVNSLKRSGMAILSFDDPFGEPWKVNLVFYLGPPSEHSFSVVVGKEPKVKEK